MKIEIKKAYEYKGRKIVILMMSGHYCAYGETKLNRDYNSELLGNYELTPSYVIEAHGGITFGASTLSITPFDKEIKYYGIDFAHAGDHTEIEGYDCPSCKYGVCKRWTLDEVEKEAERLVDGILFYEEALEEVKELLEEISKKMKVINNKLHKKTERRGEE